MRTPQLVALLLLLIGAGGPASALSPQAPGQIPEFPHIDFRWTKDDAILAFAKYDIGRLDLSPLSEEKYNAAMRDFLARFLRFASQGDFAPDLSNFGCETFERPLAAERTVRVKNIALCFWNNALILVNPRYSDGVSASEIKAELNERYKRYPRSDVWYPDVDIQDRLFEIFFHDESNIVSYFNWRYYLTIRSKMKYYWQWPDGKNDHWDDQLLFPRPRLKG